MDKDRVVVLQHAPNGDPIFQIRINGKILPHTWISRGAAKAALPIERAREARRIARQDPTYLPQKDIA